MTKLYVVLFIVLIASCEKNTPVTASDAVLSKLRAQDREDVRRITEVGAYLEKHPVYVSLTTSPERLPKILPVLKTIDLSLVSEILLVLPKRFRNTEKYPEPLPDEIVKFPKLKVLRPEFDFGPISKLIPSVEYAKAKDPKAIVMTMDDDTGAPIGIFGQLLKRIITSKKTIAVGSRGGASGDFNIQSKVFANRCEENGPCDMIEGYGVNAFLVESVPVDDMKKLSQKSSKCRLGDDVVINYALAKHGVERQRVTNKFVGSIVSFDFGFGADALHRQNDYKVSYNECVQAMETVE